MAISHDEYCVGPVAQNGPIAYRQVSANSSFSRRFAGAQRSLREWIAVHLNVALDLCILLGSFVILGMPDLRHPGGPAAMALVASVLVLVWIVAGCVLGY